MKKKSCTDKRNTESIHSIACCRCTPLSCKNLFVSNASSSSYRSRKSSRWIIKWLQFMASKPSLLRETFSKLASIGPMFPMDTKQVSFKEQLRSKDLCILSKTLDRQKSKSSNQKSHSLPLSIMINLKKKWAGKMTNMRTKKRVTKSSTKKGIMIKSQIKTMRRKRLIWTIFKGSQRQKKEKMRKK